MPEGVLKRRLNQVETLNNKVIGTLVFGVLPPLSRALPAQNSQVYQFNHIVLS